MNVCADCVNYYGEPGEVYGLCSVEGREDSEGREANDPSCDDFDPVDPGGLRERDALKTDAGLLQARLADRDREIARLREDVERLTAALATVWQWVEDASYAMGRVAPDAPRFESLDCRLDDLRADPDGTAALKYVRGLEAEVSRLGDELGLMRAERDEARKVAARKDIALLLERAKVELREDGIRDWQAATGLACGEDDEDTADLVPEDLRDHLRELTNERDVYKAECASISEEFGLPPTIRPADGEVRRMVNALRGHDANRRILDAISERFGRLPSDESVMDAIDRHLAKVEDRTLRFDLDAAGIERREAEAVELVDARARIAELERENTKVRRLYGQTVDDICARMIEDEP